MGRPMGDSDGLPRLEGPAGRRWRRNGSPAAASNDDGFGGPGLKALALLPDTSVNLCRDQEAGSA